MPRALRLVTEWRTLAKPSVLSHRIPQLPADVVHLADMRGSVGQGMEDRLLVMKPISRN
jgi:hypothetical protein